MVNNNPSFVSDSVVSVIVPVYNCAKTIGETINSVMSQTYPKWELICVDDGSIDDSVSIIQDYVRKDGRIHFIQRNRMPKGGSVCRNIGAYMASGKYLIFLDGDDLLVNTCIEKRLEEMEKTEADFLVFPMASFKDNPLQAKKCSMTHVKNMKYYFASAQGGWQVTSPIYKRDFFLSLNGFNESYPRLQDIELHLRALLKAEGNFIVKDDSNPDCLYRMGENHYSQQKIINGLKAHRLFFDLLQSNIDKFDQTKKRSIALLSNFCNIFVELNILKKTNYKEDEFYDLVNSPLVLYMRPLHKALYSFYKKVYGNKAGLFLIKTTRKVLLEKFIRFS